MKTILFMLFLICFNEVQAQHNAIENKNYTDKLASRHAQLSDDVQLRALVPVIIRLYGSAFKYYSELKHGSYRFDVGNDKKNASHTDYYLSILSSDNKQQILSRIPLRKESVNGTTEIVFDKNEISKFVNLNVLASSRYKSRLPNTPLPSTINDNNILYDQMILYNENIQEQDWRILNK